MRKNRIVEKNNNISILTLDDDAIMTVTLQSYFSSVGFNVGTENDPIKAIERIRNEQYDILLLDFLMHPINGDEVVRQIREFNSEIFIVLLTGHKSMAPPIKTIRELDIQGYYEKSDRFDELELLVESCVKSIKHMRTIKSYEKGLHNILDYVTQLNISTDINSLTDTFLEQCGRILGCEDCCIYLDFSYFADDNLLNNEGIQSYKGIGKYKFMLWDDKVMGFINGLDNEKSVHLFGGKIFALLRGNNEEAFGAIIAEADKVDKETVQLFEVYVEQAVAVLKNLILKEILNIRNRELEKMYDSVHKNYTETINTIRQMVDAKDIYTRGHSDRVSAYAVEIAKAMGKPDDFIERVKVAGLFHDIGKVAIPDSILQKPGLLSEEEYEKVKTHPVMGKRLLSSMSSLEGILDIIECHHERIDGKGYPNGLIGSQIPEEAKIISVADTFDAMTSKRTYRDSLHYEEAVAELKSCRGTQFEPEIVDTFLNILNNYDVLRKQLEWTFKSPVVSSK
ncbi:MAG: HD domain-containing protein [Candidatus Metalachnospira sp.]|nr:HD domain-containing protein [Candidatus Metalachnospira sp.]